MTVCSGVLKLCGNNKMLHHSGRVAMKCVFACVFVRKSVCEYPILSYSQRHTHCLHPHTHTHRLSPNITNGCVSRQWQRAACVCLSEHHGWYDNNENKLEPSISCLAADWCWWPIWRRVIHLTAPPLNDHPGDRLEDLPMASQDWRKWACGGKN